MSKHIVIVYDDELLRNRLGVYLSSRGFRVTTAKNAAEFRAIIGRERIDLALVDLTMPEEDGRRLTSLLRERSDIGVVILTGTGDPIERTIGLEIGADDYVAKPFRPRELLARARSALRRTESRFDRNAARTAPTLHFAGWRFDLARRTLTSPHGQEVHLTAAQFQLLQAFVANANAVLERDRLLELVAGRRWEPDDRAVDQHISRLRRKLQENPKRPALIKSVRGRGYLFAAPVDRPR